MEKQYDLILFGATGWNGVFAADYLAKYYPPQKGGETGLKWAIAGRNREKLAALKKDLLTISPQCESVGILVGDSGNQEEIDAIVKQGRVVLSAAGPYMLSGTPVVDACVRFGVHYCDITGETLWVKKIIEKYHEEAERNNVFIVNFCGFGAIPSDIGTLMMIDYVKKNLDGRDCQSVTHFCCGAKKTVNKSTGPIKTVIEMFEQPADEIAAAEHPYFLASPNSPQPPVHSDSIYFTYNRDIQQWVGTQISAAVNTQAVRRSSSLNNYGPKFVYQEYEASKSFWKAFAASCTFSLAMTLLSTGWIRRWIKRNLPPSPPIEDKESYVGQYFWGEYVAKTIPRGDEKPMTIRGKIVSEDDKSCMETSKMLCETALGLATQLNQVTEKGIRGGVHTPASSLGLILLERLRNARMVFEVTEVRK